MTRRLSNVRARARTVWAATRRRASAWTGAARRRSGTRWLRWAVVVVLACVGGWAGLLAAGSTTATVGPVEARLTLRPSLTGDSVLDIPPLGSLTLDTHDGPFRLEAQVVRVQPATARELIDDPARLPSAQAHIVGDLRHAVVVLVVKSVAGAVLGAALVTLVLLRRPRRAVLAGGLAAGVAAAGGATAALTWDPRAITHPRYEGLLTIAPSVVGNAEDIVGNFGKYREELAKIVTNVSRLYDVTSTLPTYSPGPGTVRVLFVSDIHLNPAAFSVMQSVATQFSTDFVIDAGDLTDHGSKAEDRFTDLITTMGQPYVFVRGNHDSRETQRAVSRLKNAVVLDNGAVTEIDGVRIAGMGDPRFTPDKDTRDAPTAGADEAKAGAFVRRIEEQRAEGHPVGVALIHDVTMAPQLDGAVSLILSGHIHRRNVTVLQHGTLSMQQGSTGGAGLRGLEHEQPTPIELSVLYLDRADGALRAWDDITVGGLGLSSAKIERHLPDQVGAPGKEAGHT